MFSIKLGGLMTGLEPATKTDGGDLTRCLPISPHQPLVRKVLKPHDLSLMLTKQDYRFQAIG